MNGLADAARGVRDLFGELQRLLLALAEERAAAGQRHDDLDIEIVGGVRRPGGRQGERGGEGGAELERGKGCVHHEPPRRLITSISNYSSLAGAVNISAWTNSGRGHKFLRRLSISTRRMS